MSGDLFGVAFFGLVAMVVVPVVLATVAGAAVLAIADVIDDHMRMRKVRNSYRVSSGSKGVKKYYESVSTTTEAKRKKVDKAVDDYDAETMKRLRKVEAELEEMKKAAESEAKKNADPGTASASLDLIPTEEIKKKIEERNRIIRERFGKEKTEMVRAIEKTTREELEKDLKLLKEEEETRMKLADFKDNSAAGIARQQAAALAILRDAEASVKLLENLAETSKDAHFQEQVKTYRKNYDTAKKNYDDGLYQSAAAQADSVVTGSAVLVMEQAAVEAEIENMQFDLKARLAVLAAEIGNARTLSFEHRGEIREEDLNDYSQDYLEALEEKVKEMQEQADSTWSKAKLEILMDEVEESLEPSVRETIRTASEYLASYLDRTATLEVVQDYLESQGYEMDWALPAGYDPTQELVVHFKNPAGNEISVSLDNMADAGSIEQAVMEVLMFYKDGEKPEEAVQKQLKADLDEALKKAGVRMPGGLTCTGTWGTASRKVEKREKILVEEETPKKIIR